MGRPGHMADSAKQCRAASLESIFDYSSPASVLSSPGLTGRSSNHRRRSGQAKTPGGQFDRKMLWPAVLLRGVTSIRADVKKKRRPAAPWRFRILNVLWFGRSVRTQLLIVFIAINLVAASIAGGVIMYKAGAST